MTLVILAAGLGSRYGGLKQLDPMTEQGNFIIDFSVFDALGAGFTKVVFVIKPENEQLFDETIGKRIAKYIPVEYAYQTLDTALLAGQKEKLPPERTKPLGTGHALLSAMEKIGQDNFAVINADDFYGREVFEVLAAFLKDTDRVLARYCMAGFPLRLTLTENGTVSRGICRTDAAGNLSKIDERTKIYRRADGQVVYIEDGQEYPLDENGPVSMNCWGFTPAIFPDLRRYFDEYLDSLCDGTGDPAKKEYYLPTCVDRAITAGDCTVRVLPTASRWFGVTYPEDKEAVKASIREMIADGAYPGKLWD